MDTHDAPSDLDSQITYVKAYFDEKDKSLAKTEKIVIIIRTLLRNFKAPKSMLTSRVLEDESTL